MTIYEKIKEAVAEKDVVTLSENDLEKCLSLLDAEIEGLKCLRSNLEGRTKLTYFSDNVLLEELERIIDELKKLKGP